MELPEGNNETHTVTTEETITTSTTTYGPIGRFFKSIKDHPLQSVLIGAAAVGAGTYGYFRFVATGNPLEAAEAAASAASAFSRITG